MKGIILAGGKGTRLYPTTVAFSKHLLPIYDKPMVYYPLSLLMLAGIRHVLIITTQKDLPLFNYLLGDGSNLGMRFEYIAQTEPRGLADAIIIGKDFIQQDPVCLFLGDNILFGQGLPKLLRSAARLAEGATIFAYPVKDPQNYGVVMFDEKKRILSIEEKPLHPRSNYAVPGIFFYDHQVVKMAEGLRPSERGELEITDINKLYLENNQLQVKIMSRGIAWMDAGTPESLLQASAFVQAIEERQGLMIACLEEIAYQAGYISENQLRSLVNKMPINSYSQYLSRLLAY